MPDTRCRNSVERRTKRFRFSRKSAIKGPDRRSALGKDQATYVPDPITGFSNFWFEPATSGLCRLALRRLLFCQLYRNNPDFYDQGADDDCLRVDESARGRGGCGIKRVRGHQQCRDPVSALWFGSLQGLSRWLPEPPRRNAPPPILIRGVRVRGVPQTISELGVSGQRRASWLSTWPTSNEAS
jgi:hypothetical protein